MEAACLCYFELLWTSITYKELVLVVRWVLLTHQYWVQTTIHNNCYCSFICFTAFSRTSTLYLAVSVYYFLYVKIVFGFVLFNDLVNIVLNTVILIRACFPVGVALPKSPLVYIFLLLYCYLLALVHTFVVLFLLQFQEFTSPNSTTLWTSL